MARSKKTKKKVQRAPRKRMSVSQIAFVILGVIIILSMVISLAANFVI